jgi:hypothetical protein
MLLLMSYATLTTRSVILSPKQRICFFYENKLKSLCVPVCDTGALCHRGSGLHWQLGKGPVTQGPVLGARALSIRVSNSVTRTLCHTAPDCSPCDRGAIIAVAAAHDDAHDAAHPV